MALPLRIGLTGGIGSGKSSVATLLAALGADVVDTDAIARSLTLAGGAAIGSIREVFGAAFIDAAGALDRARMREAAFADAHVRRRLEAILHPRIGEEVERRAALSAARALVFDIPLLVESGRWRSRLDRIWVVDCAESLQVARVVARSGWTEQAVRAVIDQQATRTKRRAAADAVIHNQGIDLAQLGGQVERLWRETAG